jgi:uncharacterized membrane protein YhaH (DUF805 family)
MNYDSVFASPMGRTSRGAFIGGLIVLLLAVGFYVEFVHAGRNGEWVLVTLLFPAFVLHARRLHDMGKTALLLILPLGVTLAAAWLHMYGPKSQLETPLFGAALGLGAVFTLWCLLGKSSAEANKYGAAAA